jgi:hypothetical protein
MHKFLVGGFMKHAILIIASILLLSCQGPFYLNTQGYEVMNMPLEEAWPLVAINTSSNTYQEDCDGIFFTSPKMFDDNGGGDCTAFAVKLIYLLGPDASYLGIIKPNGGKHAIVKYKDIYLEPQAYGKCYDGSKLNIIQHFDYYEIMAKATNYGTRIVEM